MSAIDAFQVPFGKVVRCPSCTIAVAVAQPQHGIQVIDRKDSIMIWFSLYGGMPSIEELVENNSTHATHAAHL